MSLMDGLTPGAPQPYDATQDPVMTQQGPGTPAVSNDLGSFDRNMQAVDSIHKSWSLPQLPGQVAMDLASISSVNPTDLAHFLYGLEGDVNNALNPVSSWSDLQAQQQTGVSQDPDSFGNVAKATFAGLEGQKAPTVVDPNSAAFVRKMAIRYGLVAKDTPLDGPWTPADNALVHGVSQAQLQSRISGNEPLSVPTSKLGKMSILDPNTLAGAVGQAVLHSFVPSGHDLNAAHTAQDNLLHHFSFGNLFKTVRSYIPVALPIATDVLMLTGIGEVIGTTRAALAVEEMPALYSAEQGIFRGMINKSIDAGAESFGRAQEPGLASRLLGRVPGSLAQRALVGGGIGGAIGAGGAVVTGHPDDALTAGLAGAGAGALLGGAAPAASDAMAAWRGLKPVAAVKSALSPIYRLGTVETAGALLGPSDSTIAQGVRANRDAINAKVMSNPILMPASAALSMAFAPPNVFRPGTFSGPLKAGSGLIKAMTMVGSDYSTERSTAEFGRGLLSDGVKANADNINQALLDAHGGDVESVGHGVTWAQHMAAIDLDAAAQAKRIVGDDASPSAFKSTFLRARSVSIGKLAHVNPGDEDQFMAILNAKANGTASGSTLNKGEDVLDAQLARDSFKSALADPDQRDQALTDMNAYIDQHNASREQFSNQVLNSLKPGMVERWTKDFFNANGNWHDFVAASDDLRNADLPGMKLSPQVGDPAANWTKTNNVSQQIADATLYRATDPATAAKAGVSPLTRDFIPAQGKVTVARIDTPTTNDIKRIMDGFRLADRYEGDLKYLASNPDAQQTLAQIFAGLSPADGQALSKNAVGRAVTATGGTALTDKLRSAAQTVNALHANADIPFSATDQANGAFSGLDRAQSAVRAARQQLDDGVPWQSQWGIKNTDLEGKLKELRRLSNFTAQDVDVDPALKSALADRGYKPVYGAMFAHPDDVREFVHPFDQLTQRQLWRMSLGTFMDPAGGDTVGSVIHQNLRNGLTDAFVKRNLMDPQAIQDPGVLGPVDDVISHLHDFIQGKQSAAMSAEDAARSDNLAKRAVTNLTNMFTPQGVRQLTMRQITEAVKGTAIEGNQGAINDVLEQIKDAHQVGFQYRGLAHLEDKARAWNVLTDGLMLGQTSSGAEMRRMLTQAGKTAAVGGVFGALGAGAQEVDSGNFDPGRLVGGAIGGAVKGLEFDAVREGLGAGARKLWPAFDNSQFVRYGYLPDALAKVRDAARFSLSPFFDARRFTKGAIIAQMQAEHAGVELPFVNSLGSLARSDGEDAVAQARSMWNAASKGEYTNFDDTERFFSQRGLLGYSPKDWMAATNYRLVNQGVDPEQAYNLTKKIYSYGVNGRSGLEQSANFLFFPFSFEKKLATATGQFFADDFSRTLAVHDALKTYDILNQQYDLTKELKDHLPLANDLEKLNAFHHGINMGRFGGMNAQYLSLFLPVMMNLTGPGDHKSAQNWATRLLPAYNDITRLRDDLAEQGHVMFGTSNLTSQAETDAGFQAQKQLKDYATTVADKAGAKLSEVTAAKPGTDLAPLKDWYETEKAKILQHYPAYGVELGKLAQQRATRDEALTQIMHLNPSDPGKQQFARFHDWATRQEQLLKDDGYDLVNKPEDIPSDISQQLREGAIRYFDNANFSGAGDTFKKLYKTYYQRQFGPIERTI